MDCLLVLSLPCISFIGDGIADLSWLLYNFLQARMNPKNNETAPPSIVTELTAEQLQQQEAGYVYRYRYNGGAATQVWLSHGRLKLFYNSLDCYQLHMSLYPASIKSILCGLFLCNNHQLSSTIWRITSNSSSF